MRPEGTFDVHYSQDMAIVRTKTQWVLLVIFVIMVMAFPQVSGIYWMNIAIRTGIALIAVLGLHVTSGLCGQINLGQAAFVGVGAYTSAILAGKLGIPFLLCLPGAGIAAGVVGLIFGAPSLKIKEFYLAMATLAAQFIIVYGVIHMPFLTGGNAGLSVPAASIGSLVFNTDTRVYYLVAVIVLIMGFFALNLSRTRVGRAFIAIRDNDLAAEVMGVNLFYYKLLAFFIGCFFAGVAGALWAHYTVYIHPDQFTLKDSVWYLGMLIIGGMGSTLGAVLGTMFVRLLDVAADYVAPILSSAFPMLPPEVTFAVSGILFAVVIILFLVFEPRGLSHRWVIFKSSYRLWPYSYY